MAIRIWQYFPINPSTSRGKEWKDPFKQWQGSVAMRAQELGLGGGPDRQSPTKGPKEGCETPVIGYGSLYLLYAVLHTFAICSFLLWSGFQPRLYSNFQSFNFCVCKIWGWFVKRTWSDDGGPIGNFEDIMQWHHILHMSKCQDMPRTKQSQQRMVLTAKLSRSSRQPREQTARHPSRPQEIMLRIMIRRLLDICHVFKTSFLQASYKWTYIHSP